MTNLYQRYTEEFRPKLLEELGIANVMQVPRLEKVTLNMGVGEAVGDRKIMEHAVADMTAIAGQKPIVCNARISEAGFKIRAGWPVAAGVTLGRTTRQSTRPPGLKFTGAFFRCDNQRRSVSGAARTAAPDAGVVYSPVASCAPSWIANSFFLLAM